MDHFGAVDGGVRITKAVGEDEFLEARIQAIACYASQVRVMFGSTTEMADRVRTYVGETALERYWHND